MTKTLEEIKCNVFDKSAYLHPLNFRTFPMEEDYVTNNVAQDAIDQAYEAGLSARPDIKAAEEEIKDRSMYYDGGETCTCPTGNYVKLSDALLALRMTEMVCEMEVYDTGEAIYLDDSDGGILYHCSNCNDESFIFGMNENGDTFTVMPKHCPSCGARVKEQS